jgi:HAD superfamily hydrolase (TIGR01484 family)
MNNLLLCCDVDRTVLPNGNASETPGVRDIFTQVVEQTGLTLVYVSGRDRRQLLDAISEYHIPVPHYAIGDVGTTLYHIQDDEWLENEDWAEHIGEDWQHSHANTLQHYLDDMPELTIQEPAKQNIHKLSFYAATDIPERRLVNAIQHRLDTHQIKANIIYSIDETIDTALVDILPQRASKLHAVEFFIERYGYDKAATVFAGDSGNDLPVLISDIPAVLVNNAHTSVKNTARRLADRQGFAQQLYFAHGGYYGLNGNYTAGILEGLAHYHPEIRQTLASIISSINN